MKKSLLAHLKKCFPDKSEGELYAFILCGNIYVDDEKVREPARKIDTRSLLEIRLKQYVSRGGYKLESAIEAWGINCSDKVFIDAGSSTGGFTDCLLQNGASLVYAVDVGFNQLDYSLRKNEKVRVYEKCNIMDMGTLKPQPHMGVADLSFRSIQGAATKIINMTSEKILIALIKPQFEVEKDEAFDGVITDPDVWRNILLNICTSLEYEGLGISRLIPSPIKGKKGGNQEFLAYIEKMTSDIDFSKKNDTVKMIDQTLSLL